VNLDESVLDEMLLSPFLVVVNPFLEVVNSYPDIGNLFLKF